MIPTHIGVGYCPGGLVAVVFDCGGNTVLTQLIGLPVDEDALMDLAHAAGDVAQVLGSWLLGLYDGDSGELQTLVDGR